MQDHVRKAYTIRQAAQEAVTGLKSQGRPLPEGVSIQEIEGLLTSICAAYEECRAGPMPIEPALIAPGKSAVLLKLEASASHHGRCLP
jgi:hypothetical protein